MISSCLLLKQFYVRINKEAKEKAAKRKSGKNKKMSKKAGFGIEGEEDEDMKLGEISAGGYGGIRLSTYNDPNKKKKKK